MVFSPIDCVFFSVVAVCLSLVLYIYWYVEISTGLKKVLEKANMGPEQALASQTWVVIMVLSILVGIILMGLFFIFIYNRKTFQLYRLQRNFIDNFTHELKTPVASLKLYLETFQKHEFPRDEQIKYIGYMVQDADRLSNNITRILDLARIESRSYEEKYIIEDLVDVTERFIQKNSHLFTGSEIKIHNPAEKAFLYPVSLPLFEMLLMNLITNGIKYNESETPRLDITFRQGVRKMRIHFEDNGIGIPKPEIKKIFRKFYQIGRSKDRTAKGTGIGLHLVESIARIHKGKIVARSKENNKGSVFSLILPLKGFSYGVDDYLAKPFNLDEFLLRVDRLSTRGDWTRKGTDSKDKGKSSLPRFYNFGENRIDFQNLEARCPAGQVRLTEQEARLLRLFIANRGKPLSREKLLEIGWGYARGTTTRTVDNFIVRFRKYFERDPKKPIHFKSLRLVGYIFEHETDLSI